MKICNQGFMLAEVVVVSVVVATVLVTLFTGLNSVFSAYETRNRYYDVDSLYVAMEVNDILLRTDSSIINTDKAIEITGNSDIISFSNFYKNNIKDGISIYITSYNSEKMLSLKKLNSNLTFSEYLDYLSGNLDFEDENYNYMIIVERRKNNDKDDCYYYALKLKY